MLFLEGLKSCRRQAGEPRESGLLFCEEAGLEALGGTVPSTGAVPTRLGSSHQHQHLMFEVMWKPLLEIYPKHGIVMSSGPLGDVPMVIVLPRQHHFVG